MVEEAEQKCSVCDAPASATGVCGRCGAAYGEQNRCPHCGSIAGVEPSSKFRYRCRICGGPRVPLVGVAVRLNDAVLESLVAARVAARKATLAKIVSHVAGGLGVSGLIFVAALLAIIGPGPLWWAFGLLAIAPAVWASLWARRRSATFDRTRDDALDAAWQQAASSVLQSSEEELDAARLGTVLRLPEAEAELLLARLGLEADVHRRVTEAGELVYSQRAPGVRVVDERFDALEEAEAEAQATEIGTDTKRSSQ